jgi:hypothetical protein
MYGTKILFKNVHRIGHKNLESVHGSASAKSSDSDRNNESRYKA